MPNRPEERVERHLVDEVQSRGGECPKWVSPGTRGRNDRILLRPVAPEHREIVARYLRFVEVKAATKKPTEQQVAWHTRLAELGFRSEVVDCKDQVDDLIEGMS